MFTSVSRHVWLNKESEEAKNAADQQQKFASQLQDLYTQQFGQNTATQQYLVNRLSGVFNRANAGQGFGQNELATLKTENAENTATAANQIAQANARRIQQVSGGGSVPNGTAAQIIGQGNTAAINAGAAGLRNINLQNSALARSTASTTASQLAGLSGSGLSFTNGLGGNATSQGGQAFQAIDTAYKPSNFWGNLGQGLLSGGLNALSGAIPGVGALKSVGSLFGGGSTPSYGNAGFQGGTAYTGEG